MANQTVEKFGKFQPLQTEYGRYMDKSRKDILQDLKNMVNLHGFALGINAQAISPSNLSPVNACCE